MGRRIVLTEGERFQGTRLTYLRTGQKDKYNHTRVIVRCDCGTVFTTYLAGIRIGNCRSCGCWQREDLSRRKTKHGHRRKGAVSDEYVIWSGLRQRVLNPDSKDAARYSERGITICERWTEFANFLEDMGPRPSKRHSIERKDNAGPYSKENCEWATMHTQSRNRRNTRLLTHNGETLCMSDWAVRIGVTPTTLCRDLKTMTLAEAIQRPRRVYRRS